MTLSLAAFIARLEGAGVPCLIVGMDGAEPPPADTAVESSGGIAGLIHARNGLARPLEVPGFCLIHLLQHSPSSCWQYTPDNRYECHREVALTPGLFECRPIRNLSDSLTEAPTRLGKGNLARQS